jgi:trimeric autotransporter adhesin
LGGIAIGGGLNQGVAAEVHTGASDGIAIGRFSDVNAGAVQSIAIGSNADVSAGATNAVAVGTNASAQQDDAIAVGDGARATGVASIAIGAGALAEGSIAMGTGAHASNGGSAFGDNSTATGVNSTAVGNGAKATPNGSAAFGQNAVATLTDQQVFGTAANTYTTPGITSPLSQSRQSGPLQLVTTDANGNLASDNGDVFKAIGQLRAGVAVALAAEAPSLTQQESFGMRVGWGNFQGDANAVALSAIGVFCRGCFTKGDRLALDASVGAGWSDYKTYSADNIVGGRAGVQWTW